MLRRRVVTALCALVATPWWFSLFSLAADAVPKLVEAITGARSFKVRVQAASLLGRIKDPRALQALVRAATYDPHPAVRLAAVRMLAKNREPSAADQARLAVTRALTDRDPAVRRQAAASMAELQRNSPPPRGAMVVAVGGIGDRTGRTSRAFRDRVRTEIRSLIEREPKVKLGELGAPEVSYIVDASVSRLDFASGPMDVEMTCGVQLVVSKPPRGIITVATGEAVVQKPRRYYQPAQRESLERQALEAAVRSAHQNLARFLAAMQ
jgi:HEAT repeat protein